MYNKAAASQEGEREKLLRWWLMAIRYTKSFGPKCSLETHFLLSLSLCLKTFWWITHCRDDVEFWIFEMIMSINYICKAFLDPPALITWVVCVIQRKFIIIPYVIRERHLSSRRMIIWGEKKNYTAKLLTAAVSYLGPYRSTLVNYDLSLAFLVSAYI